MTEDFDLDGFLLSERKCRVCGEVKDLIDGFYKTRKTRSGENAYSYECKECTKKRVYFTRRKVASKMSSSIFDRWEYPDW